MWGERGVVFSMKVGHFIRYMCVWGGGGLEQKGGSLRKVCGWVVVLSRKLGHFIRCIMCRGGGAVVVFSRKVGHFIWYMCVGMWWFWAERWVTP